MKIEKYKFHGIIIGILALAFLVIAGFTGLRLFIGALILVFLPFYIIIDLFDLSETEKIIFALFTSITLYPSLVYLLGFLISFKLSIFVVSLLLILAGILLSKYKK